MPRVPRGLTVDESKKNYYTSIAPNSLVGKSCCCGGGRAAAPAPAPESNVNSKRAEGQQKGQRRTTEDKGRGKENNTDTPRGQKKDKL